MVMSLLEKEKSTNKATDQDSSRDPKMAAVLSKAYSKFPSSRSDIEAFIRQSFDQDETQDQDLDRQDSTNNRQDQLLNRFLDLHTTMQNLLKI